MQKHVVDQPVQSKECEVGSNNRDQTHNFNIWQTYVHK